jgi:hypothetical protein
MINAGTHGAPADLLTFTVKQGQFSARLNKPAFKPAAL